MGKAKENKIFSVFTLVLIMVTAFLLRTWKLSEIPSSLSMDEVTFGYSGYSVLKTGRDENGKFLPLVFKALGDYKPPVNVYINSLSIYFFGLNEFSVRIPGAIFGSLSVLLAVLILKELGFSKGSSLFAGFWLTMSGWHIFYSRAGYEAITALFFLLCGILFFLKWRRGNQLSLSVSILTFGLSAWSYHAERVYVPVLMVLLFIISLDKFKQTFKDLRQLILPFIILLVLFIPFLYSLSESNGILSRAGDLWLVNDPVIGSKLHRGVYENIFIRIVDNNLFIIGQQLFRQYISYFNLDFILSKALKMTPPNFPDVGILTITEFIFVIMGLFFAIRSGNDFKRKLLFIFLFLGPLPGAFARGDASGIRALVWVSFILMSLAYFFENIVKKQVVILIYLFSSVVGVIYFFSIYIYSFPKFYADVWHYGYKEVAIEACDHYKDYDKVIITDKYGIELPEVKTVPYFYMLFHCEYDPGVYIESREIFNFEFRQPQWIYDNKVRNQLLIGSPWDFPENFPDNLIIKKIYFPNGKPAFYLVRT